MYTVWSEQDTPVVSSVECNYIPLSYSFSNSYVLSITPFTKWVLLNYICFVFWLVSLPRTEPDIVDYQHVQVINSRINAIYA